MVGVRVRSWRIYYAYECPDKAIITMMCEREREREIRCLVSNTPKFKVTCETMFKCHLSSLQTVRHTHTHMHRVS